MGSRGNERAHSNVLAFKRLFSLNEFACATLMVFGYLALHGYALAVAGFVWYAALFVLRT